MLFLLCDLAAAADPEVSPLEVGLHLGAGAASLSGAIGYTATSLPALYGAQGDHPDPYWNRRLRGTQLLGADAMYTSTGLHFLAAGLVAGRDPGVRRAGRIVAGAALVSQAFGVVALLAQTPEDAAHGIPSMLAMGLSGAGLVVAF